MEIKMTKIEKMVALEKLNVVFDFLHNEKTRKVTDIEIQNYKNEVCGIGYEDILDYKIRQCDEIDSVINNLIFVMKEIKEGGIC